jgi:hypothetical protein
VLPGVLLLHEVCRACSEALACIPARHVSWSSSSERPLPHCPPYAAIQRSPAKRLAISDGASPFALRRTRNHLRTALHWRCQSLGGRDSGTIAPASMPWMTTQSPCQRFARNCATRSLASPHHPTLDNTSHLRSRVGRRGGAWRREPPEHQWHARGHAASDLAQPLCPCPGGRACADGRSHSATIVGCMVWSVTASSSADSVSRSIWSRSRALNASTVLARRTCGG